MTEMDGEAQLLDDPHKVEMCYETLMIK
jgi:hypothetical protein